MTQQIGVHGALLDRQAETRGENIFKLHPEEFSFLFSIGLDPRREVALLRSSIHPAFVIPNPGAFGGGRDLLFVCPWPYSRKSTVPSYLIHGSLGGHGFSRAENSQKNWALAPEASWYFQNSDLSRLCVLCVLCVKPLSFLFSLAEGCRAPDGVGISSAALR